MDKQLLKCILDKLNTDCSNPIYVKSIGSIIEPYSITVSNPALPDILPFPNVPPYGAWEFSIDGGVTYNPYAGPFPEQAGPAGTVRVRLIHNFECAGNIEIGVGGDKWTGGIPTGGQLFLDGTQIAADTGTGFTYLYFPANIPSAGNHTVEWWHEAGPGGGTVQLGIDFRNYTCDISDCTTVYKITDCDGNVTWENADGTTYIPTGNEVRGICVTGDSCTNPTFVEICPTVKPDQNHVLVHGSNTNVPAGLKSVTISNLSGVTTVDGTFELGNGRRPNSISYSATELDGARGLLPAITLSGGTWQFSGIMPITEQ